MRPSQVARKYTTENEKRVPIARLLREHGVRGEIKAQVIAGAEQSLKKNLACTLIGAGEKTLMTRLVSCRNMGDNYLFGFDKITNPEEMKNWRGAQVFIGASERKRPDPDWIFDDEWIGAELVDANHGALGKVVKVVYTPLKTWMIYRDEKEILIPVVEDWIKMSDLNTGTIMVDLPEGLLEQ